MHFDNGIPNGHALHKVVQQKLIRTDRVVLHKRAGLHSSATFTRDRGPSATAVEYKSGTGTSLEPFACNQVGVVRASHHCCLFYLFGLYSGLHSLAVHASMSADAPTEKTSSTHFVPAVTTVCCCASLCEVAKAFLSASCSTAPSITTLCHDKSSYPCGESRVIMRENVVPFSIVAMTEC